MSKRTDDLVLLALQGKAGLRGSDITRALNDAGFDVVDAEVYCSLQFLRTRRLVERRFSGDGATYWRLAGGRSEPQRFDCGAFA